MPLFLSFLMADLGSVSSVYSGDARHEAGAAAAFFLIHWPFCGWCPSCAMGPFLTHTSEVLKSTESQDSGAWLHCLAPTILLLKHLSLQNSSHLLGALLPWYLSIQKWRGQGQRTSVHWGAVLDAINLFTTLWDKRWYFHFTDVDPDVLEVCRPPKVMELDTVSCDFAPKTSQAIYLGPGPPFHTSLPPSTDADL